MSDFVLSPQHYGLIYKIVEKSSGRTYVGQTTRRGKHLQRYWGSGKLLRKDMKVRGMESFSRAVLQYCSSQEELDQMERFYIQELKTYFPSGENGYNLLRGGTGTGGDRNPRFGIHLSPETKKLVGSANRGKTHSEDYKKKMSEALRGEKNGHFGKKHTEESRRKMSENLRGKKKGIPKTEDHRRRISAAHLGKPKTLEHRQALSEAKSTPVRCKDTGEIFPSVKIVAERLGVTPVAIHRHIRGLSKSTKNLHFEYVTKEH